MSPDIQRAFEKLEQQKRALLSELASWPVEQLSFRPDSHSWSALDVVEHLYKVEKGALAAMHSHRSDAQTVTWKDELGAFIVRLVMQSPQRVKAPAAAPAVLPGQATDLASVCEQWNRTRMRLAELVDSLAASNPRLGYFRHPRSGWMTVAQTVKFLSVHLRHHLYQLERIKRAAGSSRSLTR